MFDDLPATEIWVSLGATAAVCAIALIDRRPSRDLYILWAAAIAAFAAGLDRAPGELLLAVALTAVASVVTEPGFRWGLLALGLAGIAGSLPGSLDLGLQVATIASIAGIGPLIWHAVRRYGQATAVVLVAGTSVGVFVNVPDTEEILVVAPGLVVLAAALVVVPALRAGAMWFGSAATVGALVLWVASVGSRGRPAAYAGVIGAFGVLIAEPLASYLRAGRRWSPPVLVVMHAFAVVIASRVAGLRQSAGSATLIAAAVIVGTVALLAVVPGQRAASSRL